MTFFIDKRWSDSFFLDLFGYGTNLFKLIISSIILGLLAVEYSQREVSVFLYSSFAFHGSLIMVKTKIKQNA